MVVVSRREYWLANPQGKRENHLIMVKYSSRAKKFYIDDVPDFLKRFLQDSLTAVLIHSHKGMVGDSQQEIEDKLDALIDAYKKDETVVKKVILYQITYKATLDGEEFADDDCTNPFPKSPNRKSDRDNYVYLICDYRVLIKETVIDVKEYFDLVAWKMYQDDGKRPNSEGYFQSYKEIDWTEEREEFFKGLTGSMQEVVRRIMTFFGDFKQVDLRIDSFYKPLLTFKEE